MHVVSGVRRLVGIGGVLCAVTIGLAVWPVPRLRVDEKRVNGEQSRVNHGTQVCSVALSEDGGLLVVGGSHGRIGLWKPKTGKLAASLRHGSDTITAIAINRDGRWLVSGSRDGSVTIWDLAKREPVNRLKGHGNMITAASIGPRGRYLVTADYGGGLKLWSAATWRMEREQGLGAVVSGIAWVGDGRFVSASYDGLSRVWETREKREPRRILKGHKGKRVECLAAGKDGRVLVSGGYDQTLRVWNARTWECVRSIDNGTLPVKIAISNDGAFVLTNWDDCMKSRKPVSWRARVWNLRTGKLERSVVGHEFGVTAVAWGPDDRWFVTGSADKTTRVWRFRMGEGEDGPA